MGSVGAPWAEIWGFHQVLNITLSVLEIGVVQEGKFSLSEPVLGTERTC